MSRCDRAAVAAAVFLGTVGFIGVLAGVVWLSRGCGSPSPERAAVGEKSASPRRPAPAAPPEVEEARSAEPSTGVTAPPAAHVSEAEEPDPEGPSREAIRLTALGFLSLAHEPTPDNVAALLRSVFAHDDPRELVRAIREVLADGTLAQADANAACLVLEAALSIFRSPEWIERHGDGDASRLAAEVLRDLPGLDDSVADRLALVLVEGGLLDATHVDVLTDLLAVRPPVHIAGALLEGLSRMAPELAIPYLTSDVPELRQLAVEALLVLDGDAADGVIRDILRSAESDAFRDDVLRAVARRGRPEWAVGVLLGELDAATTAGLASGDPMLDVKALELSVLLGEAALRLGPSESRRWLATETDPERRARLIGALGEPHAGILAELAGSSSASLEDRSHALTRLSLFRRGNAEGEQLVELLEGAGSGARPRVLLAASANLLASPEGSGAFEGEGAGGSSRWRDDATSLLVEWVRDVRAPVDVRREALAALEPVLDPATFDALAREIEPRSNR